MKLRRRLALGALGSLAVAAWVSPHQLLTASDAQPEPVRRTLVFRGTEREYFVYLPPGFNRETLRSVKRVFHPGKTEDLFEPRVAKVAGSTAASGAQNIPFLVMCGSIDPRLPIAKEFVRSLESLKYHVEVEWPRTPHLCGQDGSPPDCQAEFQKYARGTAAFFRRVVQGRHSSQFEL